MNYYIHASNGKGHGIHSPFVFHFVKHILNDKKVYPAYLPVEKARQELLANKNSIKVEDFGAGSGVIKSSTRMISKIAVSSLKPKKYAQLLYRMTAFYKPASVLELGTSLGITTAYLAMGAPLAKMVTMEGSDEIANEASKTFSELGLDTIQLVRGDFDKTLPIVLKDNPNFDFVFADGNHRKAPTLDYFNKLLEHISENSVMIFDDIHWSEGMEEAWAEIKQHRSVTLSIDLFFIGIVFFRKDFKEKQHFSIRF